MTKKYDTAKTPYQRLLAQALDDVDAKLLVERFDTINPAQARREVTDLQRTLLDSAAHKNITRRGQQHAVYLYRAKLDESTKPPTRAS